MGHRNSVHNSGVFTVYKLVDRGRGLDTRIHSQSNISLLLFSFILIAGLSLIIWVFCGFHHMCLALCYGELGTMNPKAGGDYFYAHDGLGSLPGFLILWVNTVAIAPANVAVLARTAGDYIMAVMFPNCGSPLLLVMLLALWISSKLNLLYMQKEKKVVITD